MNIIPPTPEGRQQGAHGIPQMPSPQLSMPPSPSAPPLLMASGIEKGKAREVDAEPAETAGPSTSDVAETTFDNSEMIIFSAPSSAAGSPSSGRGAASGRWKDATVEAANELYRNVDATLRSFSEEHGVSFTRLVKGYLKRHGLKLGGDNRWNTYTQMHRHPEYTELELERIGVNFKDFKALGAVQQQRVRSQCWRAFQDTFDSQEQLGYALELFAEYASIEEKGKGISIGKRHKIFNALMRSLAKRVRDLSYIFRVLS